MHLRILNYPSLILITLLMAAAEAAWAGPIITGRELPSTTVSADTAQAEEYRAGIQGYINGNIESAKAHFEA